MENGVYRIGRVIVDKSLHTQSGNEPFFRYFGNDVTYSIRRTICDEDYPRFAECLENVEFGTESSTVIRMRGVNGQLRWILATVRIKDETAEPLYIVDFSDILSLNRSSTEKERIVSEYRYIIRSKVYFLYPRR